MPDVRLPLLAVISKAFTAVINTYVPPIIAVFRVGAGVTDVAWPCSIFYWVELLTFEIVWLPKKASAAAFPRLSPVESLGSIAFLPAPPAGVTVLPVYRTAYTE